VTVHIPRQQWRRCCQTTAGTSGPRRRASWASITCPGENRRVYEMQYTPAAHPKAGTACLRNQVGTVLWLVDDQQQTHRALQAGRPAGRHTAGQGLPAYSSPSSLIVIVIVPAHPPPARRHRLPDLVSISRDGCQKFHRAVRLSWCSCSLAAYALHGTALRATAQLGRVRALESSRSPSPAARNGDKKTMQWSALRSRVRGLLCACVS
jgi:hypothetical protein